LLKGKLEIFVVKRSSVLYVFLILLDIIFVRQKWMAIAGLSLGGIFSVIRFDSTVYTSRNLLSQNNLALTARLSVLKYILTQIATILLLVTSLLLDMWFFFGVTAGILAIPLVIMINGVTEALGITHNDFE